MTKPSRRLVIVVRADPVICGHATEARGLAEVALGRGFDDVRILSWPVAALQAAGLPLKPLEAILPYSEGITVERPDPVGDYRVIDGRFLHGLTGRLFELFTDGVPTVCMSMYLSPHTNAVVDALRAVRSAGLDAQVTTIAEAVGSDITNVVRTCIAEGRFGAAATLFTTYLSNDKCVAVSEYTREVILEEAQKVDLACGTRFADEIASRVQISYPAIDASQYTDLDDADVDAALAARGLERDGYVLFLSRVAAAKGADDLIEAYRASQSASTHRLVIAGTGPALAEVRALAAGDERILFLSDVGDEEKPLLMRGCAAYALPSKPRPEFVETFGIALVEKMLAGGGPVITTRTGGIPEAVGDNAIEIEPEDRAGLARAIDAALDMSEAEREAAADRARAYAMRFDRANIFDKLFADLMRSEQPAAIG
ncbi:glycosyltransferase [Glycomyces buryatensis]|uniref:Glycosyltransferase family 4 protein n=1 Tax=Glycomyces buryatensis TaxID=2570927 RepID=A0A4S8QDC4_9ACTN|nr:glycosyltransferase [Glycomyces buryatensis]THV41621.1 glycosyltransferase family 4 protein [Glycomyces buryatensis]